MKKIALSLVTAGMLGACASTPAPQPQSTAPAKTVAAGNSVSLAANNASSKAAGEAKVNASALAPHLDPASQLAQKRSVYFDYDRYTVRDAELGTVETHAKYLAGKPGLQLKIEGNADERGSRDYNLALGQKRAEAVKRRMVSTGAGETQVEAISWGKEKPRAPGHDETAWAENRRADIVYPDDKK